MFKKFGAYLIFGILVFSINLHAFSSPQEVLYGVDHDYPPYKFTAKDYISGFDIELSSLIFNNTDYFLTYSQDSWENVYTKLKNGKIDTSGLIAITAERKNEMLFSKPVLISYMGVYKKDIIRKITLQNLKEFKIAVCKERYSERILRDKLGIKDYIVYDTVPAAIEALSSDEADLLFENQEVVNYYLIQENLKGIIKQEMSGLYPVEVGYGVSKGKPELVEYINLRLEKLQKSGVFEELYQKYFIDHSDYFKKSARLKWITGAIVIAILLLVGIIALNRYIVFLKRRIYRANKELIAQKNFLNSIVDNANIMIIVWDMEGKIIKFNKFSEIETGYIEKDVLGKKWYEFMTPEETREEMLKAFESIRRGELAVNHENLVLCKDGRQIDILWNNSILYDSAGMPEVVVATGIDITARKKAVRKLIESYEVLEATHEELAATEEELKENYDELKRSQDALLVSEERYRLAVEGSNDALWDFDVQTNKLYISPRGRQIVGHPENEEIDNEALIAMIHAEDKAKYLQYMRNFFTGEVETSELEYRISGKDGVSIWVLSKGKGIWNSEGKLIRIAGSFMDITDRKKAEEEIHQLAYFDTMTELPNRALLMDRLAMALAESKRNKQRGALIYLDLDNFKTINDAQGHVFGDALLKKVADKLKACVREYDTVARLGGDEFIILQPRSNGVEDAAHLADRIINHIQEPWMINGREFYITCSMGISVYPDDGKDGATLLKNASTAVYKAKELGRNNYQLFEKSMNDTILEKLEMENHMRRALERNEFTLFYQPQVDMRSGKIVGIEALIRWRRPEGGLVPPIKFIPLAEETGLIIPIGEWVLRTACVQSIRWRECGISDLHMAVNLSGKQFQQKDIVAVIKRILEETGMNPEYLELEITESIAMQDLSHTISVLKSLKEMGIRISLDDFGTGYSSLNYLKNLPINTLKIDKHFVQEITENSNEEAIAKAVISMAHSMLLSVTAEGVETEEQLEFLKEQKCDKVQGYLFSKPLPADEIEDILRQVKMF